MSNGLKRLVKLRNWKDSYRSLHPNATSFSHYYENTRASGATRIDRNYNFGDLHVLEAKYVPLAFSDHFSHIVRISLPDPLSRILSPKCRPSFRLRPEIVRDYKFKQRLREAMVDWQRVKSFQGEIGPLQWGEFLVKPGIKKLGIQRTKEINKAKGEELNLLLLRQLYITKKIQEGQHGKL